MHFTAQLIDEVCRGYNPTIMAHGTDPWAAYTSHHLQDLELQVGN